MSVQKLLLTRAGYFDIGQVDGDDSNQCGSRGERRIRYHVAIVSPPDHLNSHGFVLDNNDVQAYFDRTYSHVTDLPSCERIAMQACHDLASIAGCVVNVEVTIGGTPQAGLTAFWSEDGVGLGCLLPRVPTPEVIPEGQSAAISVARVHGEWPDRAENGDQYDRLYGHA
jgi:hypothetical protein